MRLDFRAKIVILFPVLMVAGVLLSPPPAISQSESTYALNRQYLVGDQATYRMKIIQKAVTVGVLNDRVWHAEFQCDEQILEVRDDGTILLANTLTDLFGTVRGGGVDYNYNRLPTTSALRPTDEGYNTDSTPSQQLRKIIPPDIEGATFLITLNPRGEILSVSCRDSTVSQQSIRLVHTWLTDAYLPISKYPHQVGDTWSSVRARSEGDEERMSRLTKVIQARRLVEIQESAQSPYCIVYFWGNTHFSPSKVREKHGNVYFWETSDPPQGSSVVERHWQVNVNSGQVHRMKVEAEAYTTEPFDYRKSEIRDQRIGKSTVTTQLERTVIE
jgi:hypothetical protein